MLTTCGIYLYSTHKKRFLVCHPTRASWKQWSIPKGLKVGEEAPMVAARRELLEETGIDLSKISIAGIFPLPPVTYVSQHKVLESFLVITDEDLGEHQFVSNAVAERAYPEVDSWKWIRMVQMDKWLHESQRDNLALIARFLEKI